MRELVLQMGASIDGYVATVDGAHDSGDRGEDSAMRERKLASHADTDGGGEADAADRRAG